MPTFKASEAAKAVAVQNPADVMESVIARGDIAQLNPNDRTRYYHEVCKSIGLNPLTKPFEYITLNGKLVLYARKDATDQLRQIYKVSVTELTERLQDGVLVVTAKVVNAEGRTDIAKGAVTLGTLKGDALANAIMKAETKAKRRATLSICGLGFLDETELDTIPKQAMRRPMKERDNTAVVWDDTAEREPTTDEVQEVGDARADEWGEVQGERLTKAMNARPDAPNPEPQADPSKWFALSYSQQSGIRCGDPVFWRFLTEKYPRSYTGSAPDFVRQHCGVKSRSGLLPNTDAGRKWAALDNEFIAWKHADASVAGPNDPSAPTHGIDTGGAAGEEDDSERINRFDGELARAAEIGSAALRDAWVRVPKDDKPYLKVALDTRHKVVAAAADARAG
jgi:hypothetical protein